ncbi:MAG TPA: sulfatase [Phycisphaerae bacterium]|nr:sulfatase [Phycisphaerae bacterium]
MARQEMTRRRLMRQAGAAGAALALAGRGERKALAAATLAARTPDRKPNVLFIMSDDHTTQAIGVYGSRLAKLNPTPNIDALAKEGMRLDRVFCTNSICVPSRASIITGQYPQTNGITVLAGAIPPARQYLAIEMKKAGYSTAMVGKWHLSAEPAAFDYYCVLPGQGSYFNPQFRVRGEKPWPQSTIRKMNQHSSDAITDIGLEWLKNGRDKAKPFFLMHHFKAPHDMFQNAKRYDKYLEDVEIPEPDNLFNPPAGSQGSRGLGSGVGRTHSPWRLAGRLGIPNDLDDREYAKAGYQEYLKRYLRCVKGVDDNVKRLIDHLKEAGELDNTIIMYTGDQGFFLGEHDLMDKRWMYEEAFRMPFIVRYPKMVKPGSTNGWLINNTDFAPTILDLAGVKTPDYMQGRSFAAALKGRAKPENWRTVTYYRYWMHMAHSLKVPAHFGVRSERYKLIFFYGCSQNGGGEPTPAAWEFYDLEKDPFEMKNQYSNPEYAKIIADMKVQLKQTRKDLNETDEKYPAIQRIIDENW